jgi:hypothetical protein
MYNKRIYKPTKQQPKQQQQQQQQQQQWQEQQQEQGRRYLSGNECGCSERMCAASVVMDAT